MRLLLDIGVALALVATLAVVYAVDRRTPVTVAEAPVALTPTPEPEPEPPPPPPPEDLAPPLPPIDPTPRVAVATTPEGRFGLRALSGNPDDPSDDNKKLMFREDGTTNNTRVQVDGATPLFGGADGTTGKSDGPRPDGTFAHVWTFQDVRFEQTIEPVAGELSRRKDAVRVTYRLQNRGSAEHRVGLRVMLDTLIGDNDGVPFIVPGHEGIVTGPQMFRGERVPDFVRALERPNLTDPGVIVDLGLRSDAGERPAEVVLTHWPGPDAPWEYDRTSSFSNDTAVGLYYDTKPLGSGETRAVSFTYGLGTISSTQSKNAGLSLTAGGPFQAGGQFWLVALVQNPVAGQSVRLTLPDGLTLKPPSGAVQSVQPGATYAQVSWLIGIAPTRFGDLEVRAALEPGGNSERQKLHVRPPDARLMVVAKGPFQSGKPFWMAALVQHPRPGQTVELRLPPGLTLGRAETARKEVAIGHDYQQVNWLVQSGPRTTGPRELSVTLQPGDVRQGASVVIEAGSLIR